VGEKNVTLSLVYSGIWEFRLVGWFDKYNLKRVGDAIAPSGTLARIWEIVKYSIPDLTKKFLS